jgi:hypothetical protein
MMTDTLTITTDAEWLAAFRRLHLCNAEASGLAYLGNKGKIIALSSERDALSKALELPESNTTPHINGWYFCETLSGCYAKGTVDYRTFAHLAFEFLARQIEMVADCSVLNARQFADRFGPEATETLLDIHAEGMGNLHSAHYRIAKSADDDETGEEHVTYAPLDTDDPGFDECPYFPCEPDDEGATLITLMEFDGDLWVGLEDEVQRRVRAARVARRRPADQKGE